MVKAYETLMLNKKYWDKRHKRVRESKLMKENLLSNPTHTPINNLLMYLNKSWSDEFKKIDPDFSYCTKVHDCFYPNHSSFDGFQKSFSDQTTLIENFFNGVRVTELEEKLKNYATTKECNKAIENSVDYIRNKEKFEFCKNKYFEGNQILFGEID